MKLEFSVTATPEWNLPEAVGEEKIIAAGRWLGIDGAVWGLATVLGVNSGRAQLWRMRRSGLALPSEAGAGLWDTM